MSEFKSRVNVHSKLTIVPSLPVQPGKTHPLSLQDHAMSLHTIHVIFYYRFNRLEKKNCSDLGRLRNSLADAISCYPPVTGRLMRNDCGNWEVKCTDAGVRMLKADVQCSLDEWLKSAGGDEEKDLTVWDDMPEDTKFWSPYRVQMNDFAGGGLAIGLSCPHMNADPVCTTLFMKQWTEFYRRTRISQSPFFHSPAPRTSPNLDTNSVKNYEFNSRFESSPTSLKMSTATFRFSSAAIRNTLIDIKRKCSNATPFNMLAALFWSSITNTSSQKQVCSLSIGIDLRKLIHSDAANPLGFYGNMLIFVTVSTDKSKMEEHGLDYLTEIICDQLSSVDEEEYWSVIEWLETKKGETGKCPPPFRMYGSELTCVNMEHVPAFAAVLDDMKPVHVSCHIGNVGSNGLILVLPSPEEALGRTVVVTLPKDQIEKLCRDPAILRLEPTLLFSGEQIDSAALPL